jgi:hypothetical protein
VTQVGPAVSEVYQGGTGNVAVVTQVGGGHSIVEQTGDFETVLVHQTGAAAFSELRQLGGTGNVYTLNQVDNGFGSVSSVTQVGDGHTAHVTQFDGGSSYIEQTGGPGNVAVVTQTGAMAGVSAGASESIIFQHGTGHRAEVQQQGPDNYSLIQQSGHGNVATVSQVKH